MDFIIKANVKRGEKNLEVPLYCTMNLKYVNTHPLQQKPNLTTAIY
jgi:hypothetical protein